MTVNRREFLKRGAAAGVAAAGLAAASPANARRAPLEAPPQAVGILYDSTLCVGCKACVSACKEANDVPPDPAPEHAAWNPGLWDSPVDLSAHTYNIIKAYRHGTMATKDAETNGFAFVKRQCLHCIDPSCVSACPVTALTKDAKTGVVAYNPDACIGCRYCVFACPFGVPKYEYNEAFGRIRKCELCRHLIEDGKTPACCHVCPTGASLFGSLVDLRDEAARRISLKPGDVYAYPRGNLSGNRAFEGGQGLGQGAKLGPSEPPGKGRRERLDRDEEARAARQAARQAERVHKTDDGGHQSPHEKVVTAAYQPLPYGLNELGGTQVIYLSGVGYDKLGLPTDVPDHSYASVSEGIQHTLYKGMMAPIALLGGLAFLAHRNRAKHQDDEQSGGDQ